MVEPEAPVVVWSAGHHIVVASVHVRNAAVGEQATTNDRRSGESPRGRFPSEFGTDTSPKIRTVAGRTPGLDHRASSSGSVRFSAASRKRAAASPHTASR